MPDDLNHLFAPPVAIDSDFLDHVLVVIANLGINQSCVGMAGRLHALADDLEMIATGRTPDAVVLARAPVLSAWSYLADANGVRLMGVVQGHPNVGPGPILTSPLYAIDPQLQWARTLSRFYRLGECRQKSESRARGAH
jgi:hypothetical protein